VVAVEQLAVAKAFMVGLVAEPEIGVELATIFGQVKILLPAREIVASLTL
jgi:hypothetical protein